MRSSSTGDIACSRRSASSWTSSHGTPSTSVRKRSIRRWRRTMSSACSLAAVGEGDRAVGAARDVAVALEPADHLVHGRRATAASRARRSRRSSAARPPAARRGSAGTPPRRRSPSRRSCPDATCPGRERLRCAAARSCTRAAGLSSRQRRSFAPWRMRPAETWSKSISTTSSGRRPTHSRSRPGAPAARLARAALARSRTVSGSRRAASSPSR